MPSLRDRIRALLRDTDETDPGRIADKIASDMLGEDQREWLLSLLRDAVREVIRQERSTDVAAQGESRADRFRNSWKRHLRDRVHVGDSVFKMFADCDLEQVRFLVSERRNQAARLLLKADQYEAVADAMVSADVARVSDLPDDTLGELLS
jgi:hypothetical protein